MSSEDSIIIGTFKKLTSDADTFLFPADIFEIPNLSSISDIKTIETYAEEQLVKLENKKIKLMITGGLTVANMAAINEAAKNHFSVTVLHRNKVDGSYFSQEMYFPNGKYLDYKDNISLKVCNHRHVDISGIAVFEEVPDSYVTDISWLEENAREFLKQYKNCHLKLYVTGLTQALFAIINASALLEIPVTLMHFNYETDCYFEQPVYSHIW